MKHCNVFLFVAGCLLDLSFGIGFMNYKARGQKYNLKPYGQKYGAVATCNSKEYQCLSGQCISVTWKCDALRDCEDGDDEENCDYTKCNSNEYRCLSGKCININERCDRKQDCKHGDDEEKCSSVNYFVMPTTQTLKEYVTCNTNEFTCLSGQCISISRKCDGGKNCEGGEDETNCNYTCNSYEYKCRSGECISIQKRCDRVSDCEHGDDEENCSFKTCSSYEFKCLSGQCISISKKCDNVRNCVHGDDEEKCDYGTCNSYEYRCLSGQCISMNRKCDRVRNCIHGDDEENCDYNSCQRNEYKCSSGHCISIKKKCDGVKNCVHGDDEDECDYRTCLRHEYKCRSGHCISISQKCDGVKNCVHGDDEYECDSRECGINKKSCTNGRCINLRWWCDGTPDCEDGEDEVMCESDECGSNKFGCLSGRCIPLSWQCDGTEDCINGDDEQNCGMSLLKKYWMQMDGMMDDIKSNLRKLETQLLYVVPNTSYIITNVTYLDAVMDEVVKHLQEQTASLSKVISEERVNISKQGNAMLEEAKLLLKNLQDNMKLLPHVTDIPVNAATSCPIGFIRVRNSCYYFSDQRGSFSDASFMCHGWRSHLLTINNQQEDFSLHTGVDEIKSFWTGGNDIFKENEFIWEETGQPFSYTNWDDLRPNQLYDGNCMSMFRRSSNSTYGWKDEKCVSASLNWVCEKNVTNSYVDNVHETTKKARTTFREFKFCSKYLQEILRLLTTKPPVNVSTACTIGFKRFGDNCYFISYDEVSWYMAQYLCKEWDAELVTIDSASKQSYVEKILKGKEDETFWTGGHGLFMQNKFVWEKTRKPFQYTNWSPRQFNSPRLNMKNCVYLTPSWDIERQLRTRPWYDGTCNSRHKFICEKNVAV